MKSGLFGIFLFFCLVAPVATTFISLRFERKMVRKEVKRKIIAGLDNKDLVLIKLTRSEKKSQLRWKHAKEFEYKGQMYDIVEKEFKDGITFYWCWWDFEETSLNKKLTRLAAHAFDNSVNKQQHEKKLSNFYHSLYFEDCSTEIIWINFLFREQLPTDQPEFYQNRSNSPPSPPPQFC